MFKNLSKFMFFTTLITGTLISISSSSWIGAWMGLELNLISFIPLMINLKDMISTESSLKYFLSQAFASLILLFSVILLSFFDILNFNSPNYYFNIILNSTLLLKMGAAPFHFWFPEVMEGLNWILSIILMTWQKIAPMILISYSIDYNFFIIIILISIFIGSVGGLNQISLRKLMAYSSINHIGWLLSSFLISNFYWWIYFCFYSFLSFSIVYLFYKFKIFYFSQLFSFLNYYPILKFLLFCNFLSLGGLPPFLGFLPKWIIIQNLVFENLFLVIMMIIFTLITLFYYIRITYSAFFMNYMEIKWIYFKNLNLFSLIFFNFISLFGLLLINFLYFIF
uniref:NADH-ubiquinone oxidoreductase chain 2 n=1 Tax=Rapisma xizangense TaxID=1419479 RepID=V9PNQ8_9NEOP|nr:NADH dehydrogenase subunit 2 [Rapisma xizangense]AHA35654.1 NADH dehydrogenase subunit 2 [Rapisma xizangense]ARO47932.1 NADH dehydrogenase subunit 2 [Rapisma sp. 1 NS-2017]